MAAGSVRTKPWSSRPPRNLPPLSEKDREAVTIGREYGITHFALSFANRASDVELLRELVGPDSTIISKIESKRGVLNLDEILAASDEILIDRGDLVAGSAAGKHSAAAKGDHSQGESLQGACQCGDESA